MKAFPFTIQGAALISHDVHQDDRGYFMELYKQSDLPELPTEWAQENISVSQAGVLRGMHIQREQPQGKLITCLRGAIYDAWIDLRPESKTFKQCGSYTLVAGKGAIYLPPGLAHGFLCLSEFALVHYKCTTEYRADLDGGVRWDDPDINIDWPVPDVGPMLSDKDRALPSVASWLKEVNLSNG